MLPPDNLRNSFPSSPSQQEINDFCTAAKDGNISTVTRFLDEYGAAIVNQKDNIDARAITWAAYAGNVDVIELLLARGADINAGGTGDKAALGWAAEMGKKEAVTLLLEKGAALDTKDRDGLTPLDLARKNSYSGTAEIIERWIENQQQQHAQHVQHDQEAADRALVDARLQQLKKNCPPNLKIAPKPKNK